MITFKKLSQRPQTFLRVTGLEIKDFIKLVDLIRDDWKAFENSKKCHGRNYKIKTLEDKTICLLIYYRSYINMLFLGMLFDISDTNIVRLFQKLEKMIAHHMSLKRLEERAI